MCWAAAWCDARPLYATPRCGRRIGAQGRLPIQTGTAHHWQLVAPHERAGKLLCPTPPDSEKAALALSRLRERALPPSGSKAALLDALIAAMAARDGALLVTRNVADFDKLASELPVRVESFDSLRRGLLG